MKLRFNKAGYISLVGEDWCIQFLVKYKYWQWCWNRTEWWGATETRCIAAGPLFMYMGEIQQEIEILDLLNTEDFRESVQAAADSVDVATAPVNDLLLLAKSVTPAEVAAELLKQEQAKLDTPANTDNY